LRTGTGIGARSGAALVGCSLDRVADGPALSIDPPELQDARAAPTTTST